MNFKSTRKIILTVFTAATLICSAAIAFAADGGAGVTSYIHTIDYGNGFTYTNTVSNNASFGREESFQVQTTPNNLIKPIVLAGNVYGSMNINTAIETGRNLGYNVIGAMNTDFFSLSTGIPLGILVENGEYKASPEGYASVCFDYSGKATIVDSTSVLITMMNNGGGIANDGGSNAGKTLSLNHFNKKRGDGLGMYLYSDAFSSNTRTSTPGWGVKFKILSGTMKTAGTMYLQVVDVYKDSSPIGLESGYLVLTADETSGMEEEFNKFAVGDFVTLDTSAYGNNAVANCQWATGGGSVLLKDGDFTASATWDASLSAKNPRSALGIKADGSIIYYAVDGRNSSHSNGLTMWQLATELKAQGCVSAINFDGGGSTAFALKIPGSSSCEVLNTPSDGGLRKCASYILFVAETTADGLVHQLYLEQDGAYVYHGSVIDLSFFATDGAYSPVQAPGDVIASVVPGGYGEINDNKFTASYTAGDATVNLSSPTAGANGKGIIHVVDKLSDITVKVAGQAVTELNVEPGDVIQFEPTATFYGSSVLIGWKNYEYSISNDFGTISERGELTVSDDASGSATVTIASGGVVKEIPISVAGVFSDISGCWAESYIMKLFNEGIVQGSKGKYYPDDNIRRGDFILMLYREVGEPESSADSGFGDVSEDDYYAKAITWARENDIAQGDGDNFQPGDSMSREQSFAFICRYLEQQGLMEGEVDTAVLDNFIDSGKLASYAKEPAAALVSMGIIEGSNDKLTPASMLTRAQMAKILCLATENKSMEDENEEQE